MLNIQITLQMLQVSVTFEADIICPNESKELLPRNISALVFRYFLKFIKSITLPLLNQIHKRLEEIKVYLIKCVLKKLGYIRTIYWEHKIHNENGNKNEKN